MPIFFDDTSYLLPPLSKEQREEMQKVFESAKKLNSHFTITFSKHEPKVIPSIEQIIKSTDNEILKGTNGPDQAISH